MDKTEFEGTASEQRTRLVETAFSYLSDSDEAEDNPVWENAGHMGGWHHNKK